MGTAQLFFGLVAGCWGFIQIPESPEFGCVTVMVAGMLMVSAISKLLGVPDS
jgi:hypothetical protein